MYNKIIQDLKPLGFMWPVSNPFVFCVHHLDDYPRGNENMEPDVSLSGRMLGQDFTLKDGWRMYHGKKIPGFPAHPHRGFETITIVLNGFVDHSDSHGAAGRYGMGDLQWMTAGSGLQHCEMFPMINQDKRNPTELFQIWLNLPARDKFANPHFKMLWSETIPEVTDRDETGKKTVLKIYAGIYKEYQAPDPAPDSWAANPENGVNIWTIKMDASARWKLPASEMGKNRILYFYDGSVLRLAGLDVVKGHAIELLSDQEVIIEAVSEDAFMLFIEAMPINEPVIQQGPFVMNTAEEIQQAFYDYRTTQFGGWPWERYDNVHPREKGRFAKYKDGQIERPPKA